VRARTLFATIVALTVLLGLAVPAAASAVSAGGPVDVQIWPQDGQTIVISSVELPSGTRLPAVVRIPVVPGSTVEWAGEIVGTDASGDIVAPYKLVDGVGGQYAEFTLTKSLHGQIDSVASTLTVSGTIVSTDVDWVQSVSATQTTFSVRVPSGVSEVQVTPVPDGKPVTNELGEALYLLPSATLAAGDKLTVSLSYNTMPPVQTASTPDANAIIIGLVAGLVIAVGALVVVMRRRTTA